MIHTYKKRPHDAATKSNLDCLMTAMQAMRKKNPLAESFLVQLIVDIESSGLENPLANTKCAFGVKMDLVSDDTAPPLLSAVAYVIAVDVDSRELSMSPDHAQATRRTAQLP